MYRGLSPVFLLKKKQRGWTKAVRRCQSHGTAGSWAPLVQWCYIINKKINYFSLWFILFDSSLCKKFSSGLIHQWVTPISSFCSCFSLDDVCFSSHSGTVCLLAVGRGISSRPVYLVSVEQPFCYHQGSEYLADMLSNWPLILPVLHHLQCSRSLGWNNLLNVSLTLLHHVTVRFFVCIILPDWAMKTSCHNLPLCSLLRQKLLLLQMSSFVPLEQTGEINLSFLTCAEVYKVLGFHICCDVKAQNWM